MTFDIVGVSEKIQGGIMSIAEGILGKDPNPILVLLVWIFFLLPAYSILATVGVFVLIVIVLFNAILSLVGAVMSVFRR